MKTLYSTVLTAFILFVSTTGYSQTNPDDTARLYSVKKLQQDFKFLRTNLEKTHPVLYLYTPKKTFDSFLDSLGKSFTRPLTEFQFYNTLTLLNDKIKDGHTMLLPGNAGAWFSKQGQFFPFYCIVSEGKLFVNMNCSSDTLIKEGVEITSINGVSSGIIISELLKRQIHDGYNQTYPVWILTNYFKEYYSFLFGHPASFSIQYIDQQSRQQTTTIAALSKDSISYYRKEKYAHRLLINKEKQGIVLELRPERKAVLTIRSFDDELLRSVYQQDFKTTIDSVFNVLKQEHTHRLTIDLRDNQGGDFENGRQLLSYLINLPIDYLPGSKEYRKLQPAPNAYNLPLFVLMNGGTFSNAAIVCSYLQQANRAILIGNEAAGNKTAIAGNPSEIKLPNTQITVAISTTQYTIRNGDNNGYGVRPFVWVRPTVENIINNDDPLLQYLKRSGAY